MYRSIWWDGSEYQISTRNPDGSTRCIDQMIVAWRKFCAFRRNSSPLHRWSGTRGDHSCLNCGAWVPGYRNPPIRGCCNSQSLVVRRSAPVAL